MYTIIQHSGACTYTRNRIFLIDKVVLYIIACTKLFRDKCMHQYTKNLLYVKLSLNFETLK